MQCRQINWIEKYQWNIWKIENPQKRSIQMKITQNEYQNHQKTRKSNEWNTKNCQKWMKTNKNEKVSENENGERKLETYESLINGILRSVWGIEMKHVISQ